MSLEEILIGFLRDRELLLVLDNFEHLLSAAPLVADLLSACPRLKVLATSRSALRVRGEREYHVQPLGVPNINNLPLTTSLLAIRQLRCSQSALRRQCLASR